MNRPSFQGQSLGSRDKNQSLGHGQRPPSLHEPQKPVLTESLPYPDQRSQYPNLNAPFISNPKPRPNWMIEPVTEPTASVAQLSRAATLPVMDPGQPYHRVGEDRAIHEPYHPAERYEPFNPPRPSQGLAYQRELPSFGRSFADPRIAPDPFPLSQGQALDPEYNPLPEYHEAIDSLGEEASPRRKVSEKPHHTQRRANRDEFDGPVQYLDKPPLERIKAQEQELPHIPINLDAQEQDDVLRQVNDQLSQCAFDFMAKYQFPIPLESDKRPVQKPKDREWTEWAYLIKRLATKRRIPARVLYNGQIKQLVTVLENSLEMRHASAHQSRPPKDDRNILQLVSAGTQVAKILKDAVAMHYLDQLYQETEGLIQERRRHATSYVS